MKITSDLIYSAERSLTCDLYRPDSSQKLPVVILIPGGGWKEANKELRAPAAIALAHAGFAALAIEYTTAPESIFPAQINDISEAIKFVSSISEHYLLNKNEIALIGISAGGHLASYFGMTKGIGFPQLKAVITYHAPMDLEAYSFYDLNNRDEPNWAKKLVEDFLGSENLAEARFASPINQVNVYAKPLLAIASKEDGSVPWEQSVETVNALKTFGVDTEFLLHDGPDHMDIHPDDVKNLGWEKLWEPDVPRRLLFHTEVINFLRKHFNS